MDMTARRSICDSAIGIRITFDAKFDLLLSVIDRGRGLLKALNTLEAATCKEGNANQRGNHDQIISHSLKNTSPGTLHARQASLERYVYGLFFAGVAALVKGIEDCIEDQTVLAGDWRRLVVKDGIDKRLDFGGVRGVDIGHVGRF